jgi:hypothetical protein
MHYKAGIRYSVRADAAKYAAKRDRIVVPLGRTTSNRNRGSGAMAGHRITGLPIDATGDLQTKIACASLYDGVELARVNRA